MPRQEALGDGTWENQVEYLPTGDAVVPQQLLCDPDEFEDAAEALIEMGQLIDDRAELVLAGDIPVAGHFQVEDVLVALLALRDLGIEAQPNHLLFSTGSPWKRGVTAAPVHASRGYATYGHREHRWARGVLFELPSAPFGFHRIPGPRESRAREPRACEPRAREPRARELSRQRRSPEHGLAGSATLEASAGSVDRSEGRGARHRLLGDDVSPADVRGPRTAGIVAGAQDLEVPDTDGDGVLDPCAGHGTFIAGVIRQIAPAVDVVCHKVINSYGVGDELTVAHLLTDMFVEGGLPEVISMSFGGYGFDDKMATLARAIRRVTRRGGAVVVAAAGNDATCEITFPAALPGVVGVAATIDGGATVAAPFTNFGDWVHASTHGVDIVSCFFTNFDGFNGGAKWSGTSFSTPIVAALIAKGAAQGDARPSRDAILTAAPKTWLMGVPVPSPI